MKIILDGLMGDPVIVSASQFHNYNIPLVSTHLAGAFNQEEALVRASHVMVMAKISPMVCLQL